MTGSPPGDEVSPGDVARGAREDGWLIVDVREPGELESDGRFPGAVHIPMAGLNERAETVPRDRPVVFACRTGARSGMAAEAFRMAGWDAHNLAGGIEAWEAAGLEIERDGAGPEQAGPGRDA
ncbi:MAG TPA: rhodanese-like domain-containing protein [Solirubrobacteraceae bacterium]|nr:rhodanese-like domain-containing protein [Solirubrobacteraceae bacterium]